jgi:hypothetical protein
MSRHDNPVDALVSKLEAAGFDPKPSGPDSWNSRCPGHNGSRHNLSVKRGEDGRVLIHCHHSPGCLPEAIVQALGMSMADLFPPTNRRGRPSANGQPRRRPKGGRQAHPTPEAALARPIREYGPPTSTWVYHRPDGSEAFRVYRFDSRNPQTGEREKRATGPYTRPRGGGWSATRPAPSPCTGCPSRPRPRGST